MPSQRRPSPVASLHLEGPSHDCGRATRFWSRWLAFRFTSSEVGVIWSSADGWLGRRPPGPMPQLEDGVRHGFKVSRFPDFWPYLGGRAYSPQGSWHVSALLEGGGVSGLFSSIFVSISFEQKKFLGARWASSESESKIMC